MEKLFRYLPIKNIFSQKGCSHLTRSSRALNDINNKGQSLTDVIIEINNNCWKDVDIWLYNLSLDTFYYLNISRYTTGVPLTIPEGTYDIDLWPNDGDSGYHSYSAGCGNYGGGISVFKFEGIYLGPNCNIINID